MPYQEWEMDAQGVITNANTLRHKNISGFCGRSSSAMVCRSRSARITIEP